MLNIVLAGLLGLPCLMVAAVTAPIVAVLAIPSLLLLLFRKTSTSTDDQIPPRHVVIVGGSSGIGLAIAKECAQRGVHKISILARNQTKLDRAKDEIVQEASKSTSSSSSSSPAKIQALSVSVTDYAALEKTATSICNTDERTVLFNCAGVPYTTEFDNVPVEMYEALVKTNQLGPIYILRAFLPHMSNGCVVLCCSAAGQVGIYGYTAYSPTKFALRGLAETLHMELVKSKPGISIQIAFPVDTDTPGYQEEQKMMPELTKKLNAAAGVAKAEDTAKTMVSHAFARNPKFQVYFTFEGWMLSNLCAGMSPVADLGDALSQVALSGIFRFISLFYLNDFWRIVRQHANMEAAAKKSKEETKAD